MRMMAAAFLACTVACGATPDAAPTSASTSDSIVGGTAATAFPEAGTLDIDASSTGSWACSAVLVAPKVVLTAGHCVDGHKAWSFTAAGQTRTSTSGATYDWVENGSLAVSPNHHDIGLIFLDTVLTLTTYPTIAKNRLADGTKITNVGRIKSGFLTSTMWAADSLVSDGTAAGYPYDYLSSMIIQPGDSGGPDFVFGTHTIVSVNSGAGLAVEVLARTDLVQDWIQSQIDAHTDVSTCEDEAEPNDALATAKALAVTGTCGAIAHGEQDWFTTTFGPGSVTVDLVATGDATFAMGEVDGGACIPSMADLTTISLTTPKTKTICFKVTGAAAQTYSLNRR